MSKQKKVVIALGGNALGNTLPEQMIAVKSTSQAIVDLIEAGYKVVVTHGNGPQIGMINNAMAALTRENAKQPNTPLSVCVAMSQAYIGYDLQNALREELLNRKLSHIPVTTIVTQVRVDANDPAFSNPTKPIGHFMTAEEAAFAEKNYNYIVKEDSGRGYRRVVASPEPLEIVELDTVNILSEESVVITCGGGGIPVVRNGNHLSGASAVIDKDKTSALLAKKIDADMLIILTAVEKVAINYGTEDQRDLTSITVDEAQKYMAEGQFPAGSMGPKIDAAIAFAASKKGRISLITLLEKAKEGIVGETGTRITL